MKPTDVQCRSLKRSGAAFHRIRVFDILTALGLDGRGRFVMKQLPEHPADAPVVSGWSPVMRISQHYHFCRDKLERELKAD